VSRDSNFEISYIILVRRRVWGESWVAFRVFSDFVPIFVENALCSGISPLLTVWAIFLNCVLGFLQIGLDTRDIVAKIQFGGVTWHSLGLGDKKSLF